MDKKKNKTTIGFDLDGVIIDHTDIKIRLAANEGYELEAEQTCSEIMKNLLPSEVYKKIQYFIYEDPGEAVIQPLMAGVENNLRKIKEFFPYYLISRRNSEQSKKNAVNLLKIHKLWPAYFNERNVFFVFSREEKNTKARELGITHYIDDERKVLEKLEDVENKFFFNPFGVPEAPNGCKEIRSWDELPGCLGCGK